MLTTTQAAERLRVNQSRIRQLLAAGAFPNAQKIGRDWHIPESDVAAYEQQRRPAGRPPATREDDQSKD